MADFEPSEDITTLISDRTRRRLGRTAPPFQQRFALRRLRAGGLPADRHQSPVLEKMQTVPVQSGAHLPDD
ncbi:hypothetical protein GCM10010217_43360 [Streptomyces tubercidicus]